MAKISIGLILQTQKILYIKYITEELLILIKEDDFSSQWVGISNIKQDM